MSTNTSSDYVQRNLGQVVTLYVCVWGGRGGNGGGWGGAARLGEVLVMLSGSSTAHYLQE